MFRPSEAEYSYVMGSAVWNTLSNPGFPGGGALVSLGEGAIVAITKHAQYFMDFAGPLPWTLTHLMECLHPADVPALTVFFHSLTDASVLVANATVRCQLKDGASVWILLQSAHMPSLLPSAPNYRLLTGQEINVAKMRVGASVVGWVGTSSNEWRQLYPQMAEGLPSLSPRELEVLRYLVQGMGSKKIAEALGLSTYTVDTHRSNMLLKTGCRNTPDLVRYALEQGLV